MSSSSDSNGPIDDTPFYFWEPFARDGGLVVLSPYTTKYRGGVSPRDAKAMAMVYGVISRWSKNVPVDVKIVNRLSPDDLRQNIILIASASGNPVVRQMLADMEVHGEPLSFSLETNFWRDSLKSGSGIANLIPDYLAGELGWGAPLVTTDIGIVARGVNPHWREEKIVTFIAGIHGYGTLAAAEVFCNEEYQQEIQAGLRHRELHLTEDPNRGKATVEVILRAPVRHDQPAHQPIKSLGNIEIQFIRVNRDLERQLSMIDSESHLEKLWKKTEPPPKYQPTRQRVSVFFDELESSRRASVLLQGRVSGTCFFDLAFADSDCRTYDRHAEAAIHSGEGAKQIGKKLGRRLKEALTFSAEAEVLVPNDDEFVWFFHGPADYLRVPFEATWHDNDFLALKHPVVRSIHRRKCIRPPLNSELFESLLSNQRKLKILLVASDPDPKNRLPHAQLEIEAVQSVLKPFEASVECTIVHKRDATVDNLTRVLEAGRYHIVHYAGHSSFNPKKPEGSYLLLKDDNGDPEPLLLDRLGQIVGGAESLLAFFYLSSCEGTALGARCLDHEYEFKGIADNLVRSGVPAVLGFRSKIFDKEARALAESFYRNLWAPRREFSLPRALLRARKDLKSNFNGKATWLAPILVMQN